MKTMHRIELGKAVAVPPGATVAVDAPAGLCPLCGGTSKKRRAFESYERRCRNCHATWEPGAYVLIIDTAVPGTATTP